MPLRDHFHGELAEATRWEAIHALWPGEIVKHLMKRLPSGYFAEPRNRYDGYEIDVGTLYDPPSNGGSPANRRNGGATTRTRWKPTRPSFNLDVDFSRFDKFEVLISKDENGYSDHYHRKLVAAIEIVSLSNKDRPETRRQFVAKCAALLGNGVSVTIVDLVTKASQNLFRELLEYTGRPVTAVAASNLYAATCRSVPAERIGNRLEAWEKELILGKALPTMPLWLSDKLAFPLDLERTYEKTCAVYNLQRFD